MIPIVRSKTDLNATVCQVLSGIKEGQTQVDCPAVEEEAYFTHPIDIHYATRLN